MALIVGKRRMAEKSGESSADISANMMMMTSAPLAAPGPCKRWCSQVTFEERGFSSTVPMPTIDSKIKSTFPSQDDSKVCRCHFHSSSRHSRLHYSVAITISRRLLLSRGKTWMIAVGLMSRCRLLRQKRGRRLDLFRPICRVSNGRRVVKRWAI